MKQLDNLIPFVKDSVVREALEEISKELKRVHSIPAVTADTKSLANAVNKLTGKLK